MFLRNLPTAIIVGTLIGGSHCCFATEWISADGQISVTQPDATRFKSIGAMPPISILWASSDETVSLGVVEDNKPKGMQIIRKSLEAGFAKEMDGTIIASNLEKQGACTIFKMTA